MTNFAKPAQIAELARHPEAQYVQGESGLSYLSIPENLVNPQAQQHLCPITNTLQFRRVFVTEIGDDGIPYNAPYDG